MNNNFQHILQKLEPLLFEILQNIMPGGLIQGKEYTCASIQGGQGNSCKTNIETGVGSDFATGQTWANIIDLASKIWNCSYYKAAKNLSKQYSQDDMSRHNNYKQNNEELTPISPVPDNAPLPYKAHPQYGYAQKQWYYKDTHNQLLMCTSRFETKTGKIILSQIYATTQNTKPKWYWRAFTNKRPLYGLQKLKKNKKILLVEREKTADMAQALFPSYTVITWSGGSCAVSKIDFSPLYDKELVIFPDNDEAGFKACFELAKMLQHYATMSFIIPPQALPEGWDLEDECPSSINLQELLKTTYSLQEFAKQIFRRFSGLQIKYEVLEQEYQESNDDFDIKEWPKFSFDACPGFLGEFVQLATENSEADPAAVCITTLVRFCAEVYGYARKKDHIFILVKKFIHLNYLR